MNDTKRTALAAGLSFALSAGPGAHAEEALNQLDLVLQCASADGKFSRTVNLTEDALHVWDAGKGLFQGKACHFDSVREASYARGAYQGFRTACEITPLVYEFEMRWLAYGFSSPDQNSLHEGFRVDRTTGQFRWVKNRWGGAGEEFDISGACALTERPQPPPTKF